MFLSSRSRPEAVRARSRRLSVAGALSLTCAAALSPLFVSPAAAQGFNVEVIMSGLANPRGLAFDANGALFVAESGTGGNGASIVGGDGNTVSYGATGAVSRFFNGVQTRVLSGLPSLAPANGSGATGLHDIVFNGAGEAFGTIGLGANPAARTTLTTGGAPGNAFGQLVRLTQNGSFIAPVNVADLAGFEDTANPDGGAEDSNPYGLVAMPGGGFAVADAGGNSLLNVTSGGTVSLLATFPITPFQSVPTTVARAANGDLFVGELTGFPFPVGGADIYRVPAGGGTPTILTGGFTNIIDILVGSDGGIYVLQLSSNGIGPGPNGPGPGQIIRVDPLTGARVVIFSNPLFFPGGITQGADGAFYVSNLSVSPTGGQVLRLTAAAPEPGTLGLLALGVAGMAAARRRRRAR